MRAPNTLSAAELRAVINALNASAEALEQLTQLVRDECGLLPLGAPTAIGSLRGYVNYARATLLKAAIGELQLECPEAAQ
jgi:hypothetical protein